MIVLLIMLIAIPCNYKNIRTKFGNRMSITEINSFKNPTRKKKFHFDILKITLYELNHILINELTNPIINRRNLSFSRANYQTSMNLSLR